jgi:hypothetical protein
MYLILKTYTVFVDWPRFITINDLSSLDEDLIKLTFGSRFWFESCSNLHPYSLSNSPIKAMGCSSTQPCIPIDRWSFYTAKSDLDN